MKTGALLALGALSAAIACNAAQARGITVNDWGDVLGGGTQTILPSATSASTTDLSLFGISKPIDLSFDPGVAAAPIYNDTAIGLEEFAWGGNANSGPADPTAQVVLDPTSATTFQLSIGYAGSDPSDLYAATVSLDGIKYSASLSTNQIAFDNYLNFGYVDGAWAVTGESANGWKESTTTSAAPEIDPGSAISALTLLAGAIVVLGAGAPRRRQGAARA